MLNELPQIQDCRCQRRYMRHVLREARTEAGRAMCACGETLGEWDGAFQLHFEPEEIELGN